MMILGADSSGNQWEDHALTLPNKINGLVDFEVVRSWFSVNHSSLA